MTEAENRENLVSQALDGLVRVGTVTDRQMDKRLVRVWFEDDAMSSGWLPVSLQPAESNGCHLLLRIHLSFKHRAVAYTGKRRGRR